MNISIPRSVSGRLRYLIDQEFSGDVAAFADHVGMSQDYLALLLDHTIVSSQLQSYQCIAERLGISYVWLMAGDGDACTSDAGHASVSRSSETPTSSHQVPCPDSSECSVQSEQSVCSAGLVSLDNSSAVKGDPKETEPHAYAWDQERVDGACSEDCLSVAENDSDDITLSLPFRQDGFRVANPFQGIGLAYAIRKEDAPVRSLIRSVAEKGWGILLCEHLLGKQTSFLKRCYDHRMKQGKLPGEARFRAVNFSEHIASDRVNPMQECYIRTEEDARDFAASFLGLVCNSFRMEGDFNRYRAECECLLAAVVYFLVKLCLPVDSRGNIQELREAPTFSVPSEHQLFITGRYSSLPHAFAFLEVDDEEMLRMLRLSPQAMRMIHPILEQDAESASNSPLIHKVIAVLRNAVRCFMTPKMFWVLSGDDFDLNLANRYRPVFLSMTLNHVEVSNADSVMCSFLIDRIAVEMDRRSSNDLPCSIFTERLPALLAKRMNRWIRSAPENRVMWTVGLDSYVGTAAVMGEQKAASLYRSLGTWFVSSRTDRLTSDWMSRHVFAAEPIHGTRSSEDSGTEPDHLPVAVTQPMDEGSVLVASKTKDGDISSCLSSLDMQDLDMQDIDSNGFLAQTPLALFPENRAQESVYRENYNRILSDIGELRRLLDGFISC